MSGGDQEFDCETETKEKVMSVAWDDRERFREVLSAITLPLLSVESPKLENRSAGKNRFDGKKGFTIQLAAFQDDLHYDNYVKGVHMSGELYHFTTSAGLHNVSVGYYGDIALAKKTSKSLSEQGLDHWIRPIQLVELKRLKK